MSSSLRCVVDLLTSCLTKQLFYVLSSRVACVVGEMARIGAFGAHVVHAELGIVVHCLWTRGAPALLTDTIHTSRR
jgi:hypothetical protein